MALPRALLLLLLLGEVLAQDAATQSCHPLPDGEHPHGDPGTMNPFLG